LLSINSVRAIAAVAAIGAWPSFLVAQTPVGSDFRVDVGGADLPASHWPTRRALTTTPGGGFVAAWTTPSGDIAGRRFSASGTPIGAEFQVNSTGYSVQGEQLASDAAGNFVVVWVNDTDIFAQRFAATGTRVGLEFRVNVDTLRLHFLPSVAMAPNGEFVVAWSGSGTAYQYQHVFARRFDATGSPAGGEFQVDTMITAGDASVAMDGAGNFVIAWGEFSYSPVGVRAQRFDPGGARLGAELAVSSGSAASAWVASAPDGRFVIGWVGGGDGDGSATLARRFDAGGQPVGGELRVNVYTTGIQTGTAVAVESDGAFTIVWSSYGQDGSDGGVFGRAFDPSGVPGPEFQVNTVTTGSQKRPAVASTGEGSFVVAWHSGSSPVDGEMRARRYEPAFRAAAIAVDPAASASSNGNGVFEPGETVSVEPAWQSLNLAPQALTAVGTTFGGPGTPGNPDYLLADGAASYGMLPSGATGSCSAASDCYALGITAPSPRPAVHWDAEFREEIATPSLGAAKLWVLHVGDSFADVQRASPFYRFVESLLHRGVTGGCAAMTYCPSASTTRAQMAVFVLISREGAAYSPPACVAGSEAFDDVPASSPFCRWIEELANRGVVAGCGVGYYCPSNPVSREQMSIFVLRTLDPALNPPACVPPNLYADVPDSSPFCRWIEELTNRGVVAGCGGGNYCPNGSVTREQMGVFLAVGFGLTLYGP
jgi:S-layer family protein